MSLEVFEEQLTLEHVVSGTIVLLNLLPLPERDRGACLICILDGPFTYVVLLAS